jgi:hypothetical protein
MIDNKYHKRRKKMKHLAIASFKDTAIALPLSELSRLMEAMIAHMEQHVKEGKVQEAYYIPGWNRLVAISETESLEELVRNQNENPALGLMDIELYPLADIRESMKIVSESLKRAVSASK